MKGLWSEHFPSCEKSPETAPSDAFHSQKMKGLWSEHFPGSEKSPETGPSDAFASQKMKGISSEHFAVGEKTPETAPLGRSQRCLICPSCNAATCRILKSTTDRNPGRMFYTCPSRDHKFFTWADEVKPEELIDVPYCGGCNAGVCRARREKTGPNAGRILFMCTIKEGDGSCGYRIWKDELEMSAIIQEDETITSFQSTSAKCNETDPINTNLGDGSKQNDNGADSESNVVDSSQHSHCLEVTSRKSTSAKCNETDPTNTNLGDGSKQNDNGADSESNVVDSSQHFQCLEVTSRKIDLLKCREDKSSKSSKRPPKRSRYGDLKAPGSLVSTRSLNLLLTENSVPRHCWVAAAMSQDLSSHFRGWWGRIAFHPMPFLMPHAYKPFTIYISSPLDPTFVVRDKIVVNSGDPIFPGRSLLEVESHSNQLLIPGQNAEFSGTKPSDVALDEGCTPFDTRMDNVMSKSISKVFNKAAGILQNDLLTLLETMDIKDHEAMTQEAEATFAALDHLLLDHQDFKKRVKDFIDCAISLAEIEESMPRNDSYQELVDHCSSERMRLDEINCGHDEVVDALSNSKKRLKSMQKEVVSALDFLFQIEAELSCCEVELGDMEQQVEKIKKGKEVLEGNYVLECKQLEECKKLRKEKQREYDAAKAAFDNARMMLPG